MPVKLDSQSRAPAVGAESQIVHSLRSYVVGVRSRTGNKDCVGTAFLLGTDQEGIAYAVTCLHVVRDHSQLDLWFKPDEQPGIEIPAEVLVKAQDPAHDIAILRLLDPLPAGLRTLALESWNNRHIEFESYGFAQDTNGHFISDGWIDHKVPVPDGLSGWVTHGELLQLSYKNLVRGLSGAPVVLTETRTVVGMIVGGHHPTNRHPLKEIGYAVSGEVILALCERLGITSTQPYQASSDRTEPELIFGRSAWIDCMLLRHDPFRVLDSALDRDVVKYFWTMPEFGEILGSPSLPSTILVFGSQGSGRSALCKALEESYKTWRVLTVRYDGSSLISSDLDITSASHVRKLVESALLAVAANLEQHPDQMKYAKSRREVLRKVYCNYVDQYVNDRSKQEHLREMLDMSNKDADKSQSLSGRELLKQFCHHTRELVGYQSVVFLVDPHASDFNIVWRLYKPLIEDELSLLFDDQEPIGFRFFLDSRLRSKALAIDWIRNKQTMLLDSRALSWNEDRLRTMLAFRLGACSEPVDFIKSLTGLAPSVPELDNIAIEYADGTPYGLIAFGNRLFSLFCAKPIDPRNPYITRAVVDETIDEFKNLRKQEEIQRLVDDGESQTLELKSTLRCNLLTNKRDADIEREVAQAICGFLNSVEGGALIIGVGDDGEAIGIKHDLKTINRNANEDAFARAFDNLIESYLKMPVRDNIKPSWKSYRDVKVYYVHVNPSNKPVYFYDGNKSHYYLRQEAQTKYLDTKAAVDHVIMRYPDYRPMN